MAKKDKAETDLLDDYPHDAADTFSLKVRQMFSASLAHGPTTERLLHLWRRQRRSRHPCNFRRPLRLQLDEHQNRRSLPAPLRQ